METGDDRHPMPSTDSQNAARRVSVTFNELRRSAPRVSLVLMMAAAGWVGVVVLLGDMGAMPGTMGLGLVSFVAVWALMMTAMMLPSVAPFVTLYARALTDARRTRLSVLVVGYLLVWAAAGVPAYGLAWLADRAVGGQRISAAMLAVMLFAACGVYQLTPLKDVCLARCRAPLGFVLRYSSYRGATRDLRVGFHHGLYCLACCWSLMALLVAFGLMNVAAMVGLAVVVLVEKAWARGPAFARVVGVVSLAAAALVVWMPGLAPGLEHTSRMAGM
jgi:predicted metal-binding membrane protein